MTQMVNHAECTNFYKSKFTDKKERDKEYLHEFNNFFQAFIKTHGKLSGYIALALLVEMPPCDTM